MNYPKVGFIGLGLIGGSIAKNIRRIYKDAKIVAFDVNGQKGPNKWGHDLHFLSATKTDYNSGVNYKPYACGGIVEAGGKSTSKILAGK